MHEISETDSAVSAIQRALEAANLVYEGLVCEWNEIYVGMLSVSSRVAFFIPNKCCTGNQYFPTIIPARFSVVQHSRRYILASSVTICTG